MPVGAMIKALAVAARDRARLGEILAIASRFGRDTLLARIGLRGGDGGEDTASNLPRRTRLAIEALGPTFVKLGQILGTRGDLLAPEWIAEFEKLHSQAPTLPFDTLRAARSEEPTSELQSLMRIPYAGFCLKKK